MIRNNEASKTQAEELIYLDPQARINDQFPEYGQAASDPDTISLLQEAVDRPLAVTNPSVPVVRDISSETTNLPPAA